MCSSDLPPAHTLDVYVSPISTNGMYAGRFGGAVTVSSGSGGFLLVSGTLGANSSPSSCSLYGINCAVTTDGATSLAAHTIYGAVISATSAVASNPPLELIGADVTAAHTVAGTISTATALKVRTTQSAGAIGSCYGIYVYAPTAGSQTSWTGIRIQGRSSLGNSDIGVLSEATMNRFNGRVVVGAGGGINTVGVFHVCYDGNGVMNQGAYCSFGDSNSYAPAMMGFEVTSGDPYFGWNVLQDSTGDGQKDRKSTRLNSSH